MLVGKPRDVAPAEAVLETVVQHGLVAFVRELLVQPLPVLREAVYERFVAAVGAILEQRIDQVPSAFGAVCLRVNENDRDILIKRGAWLTLQAIVVSNIRIKIRV